MNVLRFLYRKLIGSDCVSPEAATLEKTGAFELLRHKTRLCLFSSSRRLVLAGSAADAGPPKADAGLNYPIWHARGPSIRARGCDSVVDAVTVLGCSFAGVVTFCTVRARSAVLLTLKGNTER